MLRPTLWIVAAAGLSACLRPVSAQETSAPADRFAPVEALLDRWVERERVAGVLAIVDQRNERVFEYLRGYQDLDRKVRLRHDTIFRIYSMTKPITVVAALVLFDEGKLDLEDPLAKYVPAFEKVRVGVERRDPETGRPRLDLVAPERPITIRDLMRHTSGLTYGYFGTSLVDRKVAAMNPMRPDRSLADMVEELARLPLKHQPGKVWEYGLSIDVLGRVIEVVSGTSLDRFFRERLFEPLGMKDTAFFVPAEKIERLATLYAPVRGELRRSPMTALGDPTRRPALLSGGGGLYSTARDYMRFCRMLRNGGALDGARILKAETVAEMARDQIGSTRKAGGAAAIVGPQGFGLGVAVVTRPRLAGAPAGTFWWGGAAGTVFWIDPHNEIVGLFMIQNWMQVTYGRAWQQAVYRALDS